MFAASTLASPTNWNGVFTEPMYGGSMNVCVSQLDNGDYYGQAVISTLGYMRGKIDAANDQWTGDYYLIGRSTTKGTFSLDLSLATTNSYVATWIQQPGYTITTTGTQSSTSTPSDVSCFRSDNDYLTGEAFSYTGACVFLYTMRIHNVSQVHGKTVTVYLKNWCLLGMISMGRIIIWLVTK